MVHFEDTLDLRSNSRPHKRYRTHLEKYGLSKGSMAHLPRRSYAEILTDTSSFNMTDHPLCYAMPVCFHSDIKTSFLESLPGNARRNLVKIGKAMNGYKDELSGWRCQCRCCRSAFRGNYARNQGRMDIKGISRKSALRSEDDRLVCYEDVKPSLWDEGLSEEAYWEYDAGGFGGADWSAAVDIAEEKWRNNSQGLSPSISPSTSGWNSPRTVSGSSSGDEWIVWEDDVLSASDWEVL